MADIYAADFAGIPAALTQNESLRRSVLSLIAEQPMAGKVTEGGNCLQTFRSILADLVEGGIDLDAAFRRAETELPRFTSGATEHSRRIGQNGSCEPSTEQYVQSAYLGANIGIK